MPSVRLRRWRTGQRPLTRYVIAEGNENLHGEGWAGTLQTRKDSASVAFGSVGDRIDSALLTLLLLATQSGQPDYVVFNGHDLGVGDDIGDERSFNADGCAGPANPLYLAGQHRVKTNHVGLQQQPCA